MRDQDDNDKPDELQTDPTVSTSSEIVSSNSAARPKNQPGAIAERSEKRSSHTGSESSQASFRAPRAHTKNLRSPAQAADTQDGSFINDRYRIDREIARGGMGRVYMATQLPLGRPVAIKVLRSEFTDGDPKFPQRFFLEASVSSQLVHPNIITIHDYGETDDGDLFMAMEYLDGVSLSKFIKKHAPLEDRLVVHIALQICRALRVAHKRKVIHRDLKPGNVMVVPRGEDAHFVKVLDFGLVKMLEPAEHSRNKLEELTTLDPDDDNHPINLTKAGVLLGSPRYMSPEQIRGEDLDARTDIYALGIIMYQMITGHSPFMGKTSIDVIYQHIHSEVPPITNVNCDEMLDQITQRCLLKDRRKRYPSMSDVIDELKAVQERLTGSGSEVSESLPAFTGSQSSASASIVIPEILPDPERSSKNVRSARRANSSAFQETGISINQDETPANSAQFVLDAQASSKTPMILGLGGLLIALLALIYLLIVKEEPRVQTVPRANTPKVRVPILQKTRTPEPILTTVKLSSVPRGAEIYLDGTLIGTTPKHIQVAPDTQAKSFELKLSGFELWQTERIITVRTLDIHAKLIPVPPAPPRTSKSSKTKRVRPKKPKKKKKQVKTQPKDEAPNSKKTPKKYRNNPY